MKAIFSYEDYFHAKNKLIELGDKLVGGSNLIHKLDNKQGMFGKSFGLRKFSQPSSINI